MKKEKDRMKKIVDYQGKLDKGILRSAHTYLYQQGLEEMCVYLCRRSGKASDRKKRCDLHCFICEYFMEDLKKMEDLENIDVKKLSETMEKNANYIFYETETKKLLSDALLIAEYKRKPPESIPMAKKTPNKTKKEDLLRALEQYWNGRLKQRGERTNLSKIVKQEHWEKEELMKMLQERHNRIEALYKGENELLSIEVRSRAGSRLAVGLGESKTGEVDIHLHALYGIPELPATAIKGVFHHFCIGHEGVSEEEIGRWFGTEEKAGHVIFLDALAEEYETVSDIIQNQYKRYYQNGEKKEKNPPVKEEPNLVKYHSVQINKMEIMLVINQCCKGDRERIQGLFLECLEKCSFGAKGAVGYGYFEKSL